MAADLETIKEITDKFSGKWTQVRGENLEAFYAEMGEYYHLWYAIRYFYQGRDVPHMIQY